MEINKEEEENLTFHQGSGIFTSFLTQKFLFSFSIKVAVVSFKELSHSLKDLSNLIETYFCINNRIMCSDTLATLATPSRAALPPPPSHVRQTGSGRRWKRVLVRI